MKKGPSRRALSNAFLRAKPKGKGAKPARISLITGGVKHKAGFPAVRVCPTPRLRSDRR